MKELFGLKDGDGRQYVLRVSQDLKNGEKHFDIEESNYQKAADMADRYISGCDPWRKDLKFEFNVGQWVYWSGNNPVIGRIIKGSSGDNCYALEVNGCTTTHNSCHENHLRLLTPQEIESHLRKVAEEKGLLSLGTYLHGALYNSLIYIDGRGTIDYISSLDALSYNENHIYCKGKWAEIIPDKKKLPKTKDECIQFLVDWMDSTIRHEKDFLKDYKD